MQFNLQQDLYVPSKHNNDSKLKNCYKALCKSLSSNITAANVPIIINYSVILIIKSQPLGKS